MGPIIAWSSVGLQKYSTREYWREAVLLTLWHGLYRTPTEAALLPPTQLMPTEMEDYQEEVILSLSSARELAAKAIQKAQISDTRSSMTASQPRRNIELGTGSL